MWRCSLKRVAVTYSTNRYPVAQRVSARTIPAFPRMPEVPLQLASEAVAAVRRHAGFVPPWVVFGMILLATLAVCATATMRTRTELETSATQYRQMAADIAGLQKANAALRLEVAGLQNDRNTIEAAARSRLNMVMPNEIVVSLETRTLVPTVETQTITR